MSVYIMDEANGFFMTIGRAVIPMAAFIGPFETDAEAVDYLIHMTNYNVGDKIPEGYALVRITAPMEGWKKIAPTVTDRDAFVVRKNGKRRFDNKLRYAQTQKRTVVKKKRAAKK